MSYGQVWDKRMDGQTDRQTDRRQHNLYCRIPCRVEVWGYNYTNSGGD